MSAMCGIHNGDARDVIARLPDASPSIFATSCFPIRGRKRGTTSGGLIQPDFLGDLARVLKPGAAVRFATDWANYAEWTLEHFSARHAVRRGLLSAPKTGATPWPGHVTTRYESKKLGDCAPIWLTFVRATRRGEILSAVSASRRAVLGVLKNVIFLSACIRRGRDRGDGRCRFGCGLAAGFRRAKRKRFRDRRSGYFDHVYGRRIGWRCLLYSFVAHCRRDDAARSWSRACAEAAATVGGLRRRDAGRPAGLGCGAQPV